MVCSRAFGVTADAVIAELTAKHAALCGEAPSCPLETTLQSWAKLELPVEPRSDCLPEQLRWSLGYFFRTSPAGGSAAGLVS